MRATCCRPSPCQTLILHRTGDSTIPVDVGRYMAERTPGAKYVELPGDDHLWFVGDIDSVIAEMEEFLTGARSPVERDRVLATVMFTDIVDSTSRAADLGDRRWRDIVERHDQLMRRELERHRGREVKTMGDGFLATFDGPARAIRCACSARDAIRALGLEIRAGLHTGECELLAGGDVRGIAVNIGARVGSAAGAGDTRVTHRHRPGRGLWHQVRRPGTPLAQRRTRRVAAVRRGVAATSGGALKVKRRPVDPAGRLS